MPSSFLHFYPLLVRLTLLLSALAHPLSPRAQDTIACLNTKKVPLSTSTSTNWASIIAPYNLRLAYTPAVVALPTTAQQISDSVACAAVGGLRVQARSGGHSYASYSLTGKDGNVVVDLGAFTSIAVDSKTGIATVGGGVRLGNLALGIYNQAQRALPHGTCPGVGIGGHFTHGGYGHSSRLWGLALDTIIGADVVLANGTIAHTSASQFPDLFYALKGAAESFGIIYNFYLQTLPAPSSVINWSATIPGALKSADTAAAGILALQKTVLDAKTTNGNLSFSIYTDIDGSFSLSGWCISCSLSTFKSTTLPALLAGFPTPESTSVKSLGWLDSLVSMADGAALAVPLSGYAAHDTFYAKSVVVPTSSPFTSASLKAWFGYMLKQGESAPSPWFSIINLYGGVGSAINSVSASASAYADRDALWVVQNYAYTANNALPYNKAITTFVNGLNAALGVQTAYLNYIDPELTPAQAAKAYYGAVAYDKLLGLKKTLDPGSVFWNPQSVGNADAL